MGMSVMSDVTLVPQKSDIWWVFLLQGFAGIIIGLMLITEPGATLVALTTVLGFYWLITGVLALVQVFVDRATPWVWSLLAGLVGILAGLFVLRHPLVAALTVPTVLGSRLIKSTIPLSYRVAMRLKSFNLLKAFSMRQRSL